MPRMPAPAPPAGPATLAEIDTALEAAWDDMARLLDGQAEAEVRQRFGEYAVFPALGWALLAVGDAQALAGRDAGLLHAALVRFAGCAWACWGRLDASGLHPTSGQDHCVRATPAVLAAPLGDAFLHAAFPPQLKPSAQGHAPLRHAANLLASMLHADWPHAGPTRAKALAFRDGTAGHAADRAWVGFLLAVAARDAAGAETCWAAFAQAFVRSDWGRHKPATRPAFLHGMAALAQRHGAGALDAALIERELGADRAALWRQLDGLVAAARAAPMPSAGFAGRLAFLNPPA
jgi:hypothetical protein